MQEALRPLSKRVHVTKRLPFLAGGLALLYLVIYSLGLGVGLRGVSPAISLPSITAESNAFFDALEMASEKALEGKSWPGRHFGLGKACKPLGKPDMSTLDRSRVALFLIGSGIEIGALHSRFPVSEGASVKYVDSRSLDDLRNHYPELAGVDLVAPDIIDEAETLRTIADGSQDFVIASHVLEHTDRVILSVKNQLRVLRKGGVVVLILPMRCATFDHLRSVTSWDHLFDEFNRPNAISEYREEHFREWAVALGKRSVPQRPISEDVKIHMSRDNGKGYSIHFHVWDQESLRLMLLHLQKIDFPFRVKHFEEKGFETLAVLEKL